MATETGFARTATKALKRTLALGQAGSPFCPSSWSITREASGRICAACPPQCQVGRAAIDDWESHPDNEPESVL